MRRYLLLLCVFLAILAFAVPPVFAQDAVEGAAAAASEESAAGAASAAGSAPVASGWSGPGFYLSLIKLFSAWLVVVIWAYTTDWVSQDAQMLKLDHFKWNPIVFGPMIAGIIVFWFLPVFFAGFPLLLVAYLAPLLAYVKARNDVVSDSEKVLTSKHIKSWFGGLFRVQVETEDRDPHEGGPPLVRKSRGGQTDRDDNVYLLSARQNPGFLDARKIIADGLSRRADAIMLDYTQQGVAVRHLIDGVWQEADPMEREKADPALEALKLVSGLKAEDRRSRQEGLFLAEFKRRKYNGTLSSQGTQTGERAMLQFEGERTHFKTLDDLGMRPKMQAQVREVMASEQGFFLISAMPAAGLRSTTNVILHDSDRFVREFMTLEDENNRYEPVENVQLSTYNNADPEKQLKEMMRRFFLQEPNVAIIRDLVDGEMIATLCREILEEKRLVVSTIRAKDSADALVRLAAMKAPLAEVAKCITAVLNQRLVRKLCDDCKEAYAPPPNVLQQLGIPPGRVQAFYRPPQPPEDPKQICRTCDGLGYLGRIAIFELLLVGDNLRAALAAQPSAEALRAAARKDGYQSLQQEGIVLVAKGITSLPELTRVLKQ